MTEFMMKSISVAMIECALRQTPGDMKRVRTKGKRECDEETKTMK